MAEGIVELTDQNFESSVLQSGKLTLVDFWAEWCAPCRALTPVVAQLATQYAGKMVVGKMNIDDHPQTPGRFAIRAIPTLLLFKDGQVVEQLVGLVSKSKLDDVLQKHLS